jgi:hypothetical protein
MTDVQEDDAGGEAREVVMTETETATTAATETETETEAGAMATNDWSDPAQLCKVIRVDHCGVGDGSQMQGGLYELARDIHRKRQNWDNPLGIRNMKKKNSLDDDTERERLSG